MLRTSTPSALGRHVLVAAIVVLAIGTAQAQTHSYTLSGTLTAVDPTAPAFPPALMNLTVGMPFEMRVSYPFASVPSPNPFSGLQGFASLYALSPYTATLTVGGHTLSSWSGPLGLAAFVWNDDPIATSSNDGLLFTNVPATGEAQFRMGNLLLPSNLFSNEALPTQTLGGGFLLRLGSAGQTDWLFGEGSTLVFGSPVPELPPAAMLAAGLLALGLRRCARRPGF